MTTLHHVHGLICPSCEDKLLSAHPDLGVWFRTVKTKFPDAHISWSYRGKEDQEKFFIDGKTRAHFPHSPHNREENGKPMSHALDLFELTDQGSAAFPPKFYFDIAQESKKLGFAIKWGGEFKSISDHDHYQIDMG